MIEIRIGEPKQTLFSWVKMTKLTLVMMLNISVSINSASTLYLLNIRYFENERDTKTECVGHFAFVIVIERTEKQMEQQNRSTLSMRIKSETHRQCQLRCP